jgi:hypothetical protein
MRKREAQVQRQTVDLTGYPELVVVYLGMRVQMIRGLPLLAGLGPRIRRSWQAEPDGLLLHEDIVWSLFPPHVGMRQYWRDFDSLERWTRSEPHKLWWRRLLERSGATGLWHEAYLVGGRAEAIYVDMRRPVGMARFAPIVPAHGAMASARQRASLPDADAARER